MNFFIFISCKAEFFLVSSACLWEKLDIKNAFFLSRLEDSWLFFRWIFSIAYIFSHYLNDVCDLKLLLFSEIVLGHYFIVSYM